MDWGKLGVTLDWKPNMYGIWFVKQSSGMCATQHYLSWQEKTLARQLDKTCPNCGQVETLKHLIQISEEGAVALEEWIYQDGQTNPEVAYWVPTHIIL